MLRRMRLRIVLGQCTYSVGAVFLSGQAEPSRSQALHVDHDNALPLGAIWLFDESTQVIWIAGEQDATTESIAQR
jgi:hypothetical protein